MKNIHLIPTDKPSRIIYNDANQLCYQSNKSFKNDRKNRKKFNIYITNDEEIKEGDWFIQTTYEGVFKCSDAKIEYIYFDRDSYEPIAYCKKIILTTDQDLINDGVQSIDDDFLEWFVKNPSCEKVDLDTFSMGDKILYNVVFPKEEPKDVILGYKTSLDAQMLDKVEPKKETLEEVELAILFHNTYEKLAPSFGYETRVDTKSFETTTPNGMLMIAVCKEIIKWQKERMYSEKEVIAIVEKSKTTGLTAEYLLLTKQLKKK